MHPVLFKIPIPEFLHGILPATLTIHSYGMLIALGAISGLIYLRYNAKQRFNVDGERIQMLFVLIVVAAILGGKVLLVFEDPGTYVSNPSLILQNFRNGFVFYGSLLFAIIAMLLFFKHYSMPIMGMLDIMAGTTAIVHAFGRMGCFMAGCCYGKPYNGALSVTFTDPQCSAEPLNTPLHPTQLYSVALILIILVVILMVNRRKQFEGQLFMLYLMLYAVGRSVIEIFRGDEERGFVIDGILSNSQFISLLFFSAALYVYVRLARSPVRHPDGQMLLKH
jgi:phosphatidylglycerol:prolipoprotein diacylglycerol transferase